MIFNLKSRLGCFLAAKTTILLWLSVVFFFALSTGEASAQKRFSKTYPAGSDVRLQLLNHSGTVTVEGWDRAQVSISAYMESPSANINPYIQGNTININLVKDNQGRGDVGSVNFTIRVPYDARVDIETRMGNLNVSNVRGALVRAHISSDGDIELTNIASNMVSAENGIGNIFYDGEIRPGGTYRFTSLSGRINLRIPFNSSFKLTATAPSTRAINLGTFSGSDMRYVSDGRRVVGNVAGGSSTLIVTNQRGSIAFIRR